METEVLALLTPWLEARELVALRSVDRRTRAQLPRLTWELSVCDVRSGAALPAVARQFPNVNALRLRRVLLPLEALSLALAKLLAAGWRLRELELRQVVSLHDGQLRVLTEEWDALERLVIDRCDQVRTPPVIGPKLRHLSVRSHAFSAIHRDSRLPELRELAIASTTLVASSARELVKQSLRAAPLVERLDLSGCSAVEQILVDPGDLPRLRYLSVRGCIALERLHVSSKSLQELQVGMCDHLSHIVLDVSPVEGLDLSLLKNLTHLYIRSSSLSVLRLRGSCCLERSTTQVLCPSLRVADLDGTGLTIEDLAGVELEGTSSVQSVSQ